MQAIKSINLLLMFIAISGGIVWNLRCDASEIAYVVPLIPEDIPDKVVPQKGGKSENGEVKSDYYYFHMLGYACFLSEILAKKPIETDPQVSGLEISIRAYRDGYKLAETRYNKLVASGNSDNLLKEMKAESCRLMDLMEKAGAKAKEGR